MLLFAVEKAVATPFGDLFSAIQVPEIVTKLLSPILGVSAMQGLMHGSDRLAKLEITISSAIPLANKICSVVGTKFDNKFAKKTIGWTTWLVTLVSGIIGMDTIITKILVVMNKRNNSKQETGLILIRLRSSM